MRILFLLFFFLGGDKYETEQRKRQKIEGCNLDKS